MKRDSTLIHQALRAEMAEYRLWKDDVVDQLLRRGDVRLVNCTNKPEASIAVEHFLRAYAKHQVGPMWLWLDTVGPTAFVDWIIAHPSRDIIDREISAEIAALNLFEIDIRP